MAFKSPWKKKTSIAVGIFIAFLILMFWQEAKADTNVEITASGFTGIGGERYDSETLIFNETFNDRKYQLGIALQLRLDCRPDNACKRGEQGANQAIYIQRLVHYKKFEMGFGMSYWHNQSIAWNSHTPYVLSIGWNFSQHLALNYKHFSTGGSSTNNGGMDFVAVRYSF